MKWRYPNSAGLYQAPLRVTENNHTISLGGIYVHINELTDGFVIQSTDACLRDRRIEVTHILRHPKLAEPTTVSVSLWMETGDRGLSARITVEGKDQHLDRLGWGEHSGERLVAERMFFGRMYVLDKPQATPVPSTLAQLPGLRGSKGVGDDKVWAIALGVTMANRIWPRRGKCASE